MTTGQQSLSMPSFLLHLGKKGRTQRRQMNLARYVHEIAAGYVRRHRSAWLKQLAF